MRPYFTFFVISAYLSLSLIYIREFGFDAYLRVFLGGWIGYFFSFIAGALVVDLLRGER